MVALDGIHDTEAVEAVLVQAMEQHAKASELEKQAEKLKNEARAVILDWAKKHTTLLLSAGGEFERAGFKTAIVVPYKKGEPRRFNQDVAWNLRNFLLDLYGDSTERFFDCVYTFKLDRFLDACHAGEIKPTGPVLVRIDRDMLPAEEDMPQTPRVSTKKL